MEVLQLKLAPFSLGKLTLHMPHINLNTLQLFKTFDSSEFLELEAVVQALPRVFDNVAQPVNQNVVVNVVRAQEGRGGLQTVKLLINPVSSSSLVSRTRMEMFSTFLSSRCWNFRCVVKQETLLLFNMWVPCL